jgi:hypothetical protein
MVPAETQRQGETPGCGVARPREGQPPSSEKPPYSSRNPLIDIEADSQSRAVCAEQSGLQAGPGPPEPVAGTNGAAHRVPDGRAYEGPMGNTMNMMGGTTGWTYVQPVGGPPSFAPPGSNMMYPGTYMMYMPMPHIAPRLAPPFIEKSNKPSGGSGRSPRSQEGPGAQHGAPAAMGANATPREALQDDNKQESENETTNKEDQGGKSQGHGGHAQDHPASPSHVDRREPSKPCAFFLQHGSCAFGSKCKFSHPIELAPVVEYNSVGLPRRYGQPACRFYVQTGRCSYGYTCKFDHPELGSYHQSSAHSGGPPGSPYLG